jgi:hypothetical protein
LSIVDAVFILVAPFHGLGTYSWTIHQV